MEDQDLVICPELPDIGHGDDFDLVSAFGIADAAARRRNGLSLQQTTTPSPNITITVVTHHSAGLNSDQVEYPTGDLGRNDRIRKNVLHLAFHSTREGAMDAAVQEQRGKTPWISVHVSNSVGAQTIFDGHTRPPSLIQLRKAIAEANAEPTPASLEPA